jgi:hypothetical protein
MKANFRQSRRRQAFLTIVATLAGGTTFTSCDSKVKSAVTSALETTFLSLFDASLYLDTGDSTGTGSLSDQ